MNTRAIIERIKTKYNLPETASVGLMGSFDSKAHVDLENRYIRAIATTPSIDSAKEVIIPEGADFSYWDRTKGIYVDHIYDMDHYIGTLVNRRMLKTGGWEILFYVLPLSKNAYGDDILTIAQTCGIGLSIGFVPLERDKPTEAEVEKYGRGKSFDFILRKYELIECSVTMMPCNADCVSLEVFNQEKKLSILDELVTKSAIKRETGRLFGLEAKKTLVVPSRRILTVKEGTAKKKIVVR